MLMENTDFINVVTEKLKTTCTNESPWINKKQACKYLGISNNTLSKWIQELDFPVSRIEGCYLLKQNDIDDWVKNYKKK